MPPFPVYAILLPMPFNSTTYLPNVTPIHRMDARVKMLLLVGYSITLFLVKTWGGLACCTALFVLCATCARMPVWRTLRQLTPLTIILAITLVANSFSFDMASPPSLAGAEDVLAGTLGALPPIAIIGNFGFMPAGFAHGCYYVLRVVLLVFASIVLTSTTTSTDMVRALESFLNPLARIKVPTHDVATIVSIALRFIPVTVDEFQLVQAAQTARGAGFNVGRLSTRLKAWQTVLIPLFVGLYRRADYLAVAMDARCYGKANPTQLDPQACTVRSGLLLIGGYAVLVILASLL